jgi:very-short-patch-repair endonuclease
MPTHSHIESVLIALVKDRADHAILHEQLWYRIPVESAPKIVVQKKVRYMGFYLPAVFGEAQKWQIQHYGKVGRIAEVTRQELFPNEPVGSTKAQKKYYRIELESLESLSQPIVSRRGHRLLFVPTTEEKFFNTQDLNALFNASPLEDLLFEKMRALGIISERQWLVHIDKTRKYWLDFAIFCKEGCIDVECDGDRYHNAPDQVKYDKTRNNELTTQGWSVLRYPTETLTTRMDYVMEEITDNINRYKGLAKQEGRGGYVNLPRPSKNGQMNLFG